MTTIKQLQQKLKKIEKQPQSYNQVVKIRALKHLIQEKEGYII